MLLFGEYWDRQFSALAQSMHGREDACVFDVIDNDSRWAQDFTRDVYQASIKDAMNYVRQEDDLAVAGGLGNLLALYGDNIPVSLNTA